MRVRLSGPGIKEGVEWETEFTLERRITVEELFPILTVVMPRSGPLLSGAYPSPLARRDVRVLVGRRRMEPGELLSDDDEVEIHVGGRTRRGRQRSE